ncbi:MAG TPA: hypothetical protein VGJ82_20475 [Thermoanaerobaculia bacterium]
MDEDIRNTLSRLLDETIDGRRALEAKVASNTDRILTILDVHSKQLDSLTAEHYSMRGALLRVEETMTRLESSVSKLESDFRENRLSYAQVLEEVRELRARMDATQERLAQIESAARRDHDA